jgi:hypothetical protein
MISYNYICLWLLIMCQICNLYYNNVLCVVFCEFVTNRNDFVAKLH